MSTSYDLLATLRIEPPAPHHLRTLAPRVSGDGPRRGMYGYALAITDEAEVRVLWDENDDGPLIEDVSPEHLVFHRERPTSTPVPDDLLDAAAAVLDSECGVKSMSELAAAVKRHGGTDFTAENPDPDDDDPRRSQRRAEAIEAEEEAHADLRDIEEGYTP